MGLLYTLCVITPLLAACTVVSLRRFWRARGMLPQLGLDSELSGIPCVSKFLPERLCCGARVIYSGVQYVVRPGISMPCIVMKAAFCETTL